VAAFDRSTYEATLGADHERTVHARELVAELAAIHPPAPP